MDSLPDPASPYFERDAAGSIRRRLDGCGGLPRSLCEARLNEEEFKRLRSWAAGVEKRKLDGNPNDCGLVLLAFISEWNRRHSPGDSVWSGLNECFGDSSARNYLFMTDGNPKDCLRELVRDVCEKSKLRHVFDVDRKEAQPWYLSMQLQYGFSMPQIREQLVNWLCGQPPPEAASRLLAPEGGCRSDSFLRLVRDLRSYRKNDLPESELRRTLKDNPWVLPSWENEIVELVLRPLQKRDTDESDSRPRAARCDEKATPGRGSLQKREKDESDFLAAPRVAWKGEPEVSCRVGALPDHLDRPRYVLRQGGRVVARYYRLHSGAIEADRRDARLSIDGPEVVVTLETPDGQVVEVQTIRLWNPDLAAQTRPIGRKAEEAVERLQEGKQVLITSSEAVVIPEPAAWRAVGPAGRWRWWLLDGKDPVRVEDQDVEWNGEPPPPPPPWASGVFVGAEPANRAFRLGDHVVFRITAPPRVKVERAFMDGQRSDFTDPTEARTNPIPVRPEMSGRIQCRVRVTRDGKAAVAHPEVGLCVRGVVWADDGTEIPRDKELSCFEASRRPARLLSDGPAFLLEGREILGELPTDRPSRIPRILGTGERLIVADGRFNTRDHFDVAKYAWDSGVVQSLELQGDQVRLRLFHPLPPNDRHRLFAWAPGRDPTTLDASKISTEDHDRTWSCRIPWKPKTLLVSIVYKGRCLGTAWQGRIEDLFDPDGSKCMDTLARIALIRWCRLPALRPDPDDPRRPLIARLTRDPLPMVRVGLLDEGLPDEFDLTFEDRHSPRGELFNAVFRGAFLTAPGENLAAVFNELKRESFTRLLAYHPLLGGRALQAVLPEMAKQNIPQTVALLRTIRRNLLSLGGKVDKGDVLRREEELLTRGCNEGRLLDEYAVREGIERPTLDHLFTNVPLKNVENDNLRTALGVASFREYLAAQILHRFIDERSQASEPQPCPRTSTPSLSKKRSAAAWSTSPLRTSSRGT